MTSLTNTHVMFMHVTRLHAENVGHESLAGDESEDEDSCDDVDDADEHEAVVEECQRPSRRIHLATIVELQVRRTRASIQKHLHEADA